MGKYFLLFIIFIAGCSVPIIPPPPQFEPTLTEETNAICLNPCQRGRYYRLIQARKEMLFYIETSKNNIVTQEASRNLYIIDGYIEDLLVKGKCKK